jgi:hypothetical protein
MTRMIFAAVATVSALVSGLLPARAYEAPWCAMIQNGTGSVYWDCQYRSFEECYSKGNILGGNRGFCNPSPYYVAGSAEQSQTRKRRARPQ